MLSKIGQFTKIPSDFAKFLGPYPKKQVFRPG